MLWRGIPCKYKLIILVQLVFGHMNLLFGYWIVKSSNYKLNSYKVINQKRIKQQLTHSWNGSSLTFLIWFCSQNSLIVFNPLKVVDESIEARINHHLNHRWPSKGLFSHKIVVDLLLLQIKVHFPGFTSTFHRLLKPTTSVSIDGILQIIV